MLPVLVTLLALVVQVALLVRDQITVVHAARTAARAAIVDPRLSAATAAARSAGGVAAAASVRFDGTPAPGSLLGVTVSATPTRVPLVGSLVARRHLTQRFVVFVEESG